MQRGAKSNAITPSAGATPTEAVCPRQDRKDASASVSEASLTGAGSGTPRESPPAEKQTNKGRDGRTTKGSPQLYLDAVAGLKLPGRERRKGRLCNVSAKSQSQTHLHLRRLPVGFEFFRVASPGASRSTNAQHSPAKRSTAQPVSPLHKRHVQKGSLMIQTSV